VRKLAAAASSLLFACASGAEGPVNTQGSGPPEVRAEVVARHASQLDDELGPRPAGSQEEQIASQYVLGHLQRAGYLVRLDAVPVGNLIESSNLLALPPSENDPRVVVVAPYGTPEGVAAGGEEIGFLLELARAFNVVAPEHDVEFAAVGADAATDRQHLGSRRLIRLLLEEEVDPQIVLIEEVGSGAPVRAAGPLSGEIEAEDMDDGDASVFAESGLEYVSTSGDPVELGDALIEYLERVGG
jgi:hypothetical protein